MSNKITLNTHLYDPLLGGALKPLRQAMLNALPEDKELHILDFCCGTGDQLRSFDNAGYMNLHGLDLDPGMIAFAKSRSASIKYIVGDASDTKLPAASFDIITLSLAMHDKSQTLREAILQEASRLIKTEGMILIADFVFDEQTKFIGRFLITAVEGFAGGDHFRNFKNYRDRGGMLKVLPKDLFKAEEIARILKNGIGVWRLSTEH